MRKLPLRESGEVTLDANGDGTVELTCDVEQWDIAMCGLRVQPRPVTLEPECSVYIDGLFVGGSQSASLDSDSTFNQMMQKSQKIRAVWTGGDVGSTAILTLTGSRILNP